MRNVGSPTHRFNTPQPQRIRQTRCWNEHTLPNLKPVLVELRLDEVDSRGGAVAEMIASTARPMALSISPELMWYSFVLNDRAITRIMPGTRAHCTISFINHDGAKEVFLWHGGRLRRRIVDKRVDPHHSV
jgi:hypothetical protein